MCVGLDWQIQLFPLSPWSLLLGGEPSVKIVYVHDPSLPLMHSSLLVMANDIPRQETCFEEWLNPPRNT